MSDKDAFIGLWVTKQVKDKIEERATQKGMKVAEYIRGLVDKDLEKV